MDLPPEMATWEDEDEFIARFPSLTAWGQASSKGGGNVTTRASIAQSSK
jgi:hypothetical protein